MKTSYLTKGFRALAARRFPDRAAMLHTAFDRRLAELRRENAGVSKEKRRHLESQILPGIAAYEALRIVMPQEEALQAVRSCAIASATAMILPITRCTQSCYGTGQRRWDGAATAVISACSCGRTDDTQCAFAPVMRPQARDRGFFTVS